MSAEKSSVPEFDFEYGEDFARHIEEFEPDFVKILARYNPEGDRELNRRQAERLARLSDYLAPRETKYLFELIVPAEPHQLAALESDSGALRDRAAPAARGDGDRRAPGGGRRARHLEGRGPRDGGGLQARRRRRARRRPRRRRLRRARRRRRRGDRRALAAPGRHASTGSSASPSAARSSGTPSRAGSPATPTARPRSSGSPTTTAARSSCTRAPRRPPSEPYERRLPREPCDGAGVRHAA